MIVLKGFHMTKRPAAPQALKPGSEEAELAAAVAGFSVEAAELPPLIAEHAYGSGNYPYNRPPKRKTYEAELHALQIELLMLQEW